MTSTARPCKAITKHGKPCAGRCLPGRDYCLFHDPARAVERAAARRAGGKARHGRNIGPVGAPEPPPSLSSIAGIQLLLNRAVGDCLKMEPSLARARTLGALCGVAMKVFEIGEMEQRLAALEALFQQQQGVISGNGNKTPFRAN